MVFFADTAVGMRFRKRFMSDVLHAFDCLNMHTSQGIYHELLTGKFVQNSS